MAPPELPARVVETLRCQQTLGPLEQREDGLWSPAAELLYPVRDGIVFMGYDERETQWMQETMEEERLWQGTPASVQQDLEYLRGSAPGLVDVINLVDKLGAVPDRRRLIDVGSGSGWGSLGGVDAAPVGAHGQPHSITVSLPPLSAVYFRSEADG